MASAAMAAAPAERPTSRFILHRSEVTAHSMELLERAGATKASARARGREEGFACAVKGASPSFVPVILVPAYPFRPLGKPVERERIAELNSQKMREVVQQTRMGHEHDARPKLREADREADRPAEGQDGELDAYSDGDNSDADPDGRRPPTEPKQTLGRSGGRNLPSYTSRRQVLDGFAKLRDSIRESESRVHQVKMDAATVVCGLSREATLIEGLLPPRERYAPAPASKRQSGARPSSSSSSSATARGSAEERLAGSTGGSLSARAPPRPHRQPAAPSEHRHAGTARARMRESDRMQDRRKDVLSVRLPSLAEFVARAGQPAGGRVERREIAKERELTNQLLGLDKDTTLESVRSVSGRGRRDFKKFLGTPAFDIKATAAHKDDVESADIRRLVSERAHLGGQAAAADGITEQELGEDDESQGHPDRADNGQIGSEKHSAEEGPRADAADRAQGGIRQLQERVDGCCQRADAQREGLQSVLTDYQSLRESNRGRLLDHLRFMDDDRPNRVRRRLKLESGAHLEPGSEERLRRQAELHRELLQAAQAHKGTLHGVVHWMLDSVKHVLECGEELRRETLFAILERIEVQEFSRLVSALAVNMARGIGVEPAELAAWFQRTRGEVPPKLLELIEGGRQRSHHVASPEPLSSRSGGAGGRGAAFFVTEQG